MLPDINLRPIAEAVSITLGISALVGVLYKTVINPIARKWAAIGKLEALADNAQAIVSLGDRVDAIGKQVSAIYHETQTNGGGSIKDAVHRIELRQMARERRADILLMDAPNGIFEADADGAVHSTNRTYRRLTGRSSEELMGHNWVLSVHPDDRDEVLDEWQQAIQQKREYSQEYRVLHPDGSTTMVRSAAFPLTTHSGELVGYVGMVTKVETLGGNSATIAEGA